MLISIKYQHIMSQQFNEIHNSFFKSFEGAYSEITSKDEATHGQITLTGHETHIAQSFFGKSNIHRGSIKGSNGKGYKTFHHYNSNSPVQVGLNYPKPKGSELRLYMKGNFQGDAGDIWFIFLNAQGINIGTMDATQWSELKNLDNEDPAYQAVIQNYLEAPPQKKSMVVSSFKRNPAIAVAALEAANFKCENNPSHSTFNTKSGMQHMEAHHIIPLSKQGRFGFSLDNASNIACLCPNCHSLAHLGIENDKHQLLEKIYKSKADFFNQPEIAVDFEILKSFY